MCFGLPGIVDENKSLVHTAPSIIDIPRDLKKELQAKIKAPVFINNDVDPHGPSQSRYYLGGGVLVCVALV